jgi:predicted nicotinamide N-methyase
MLEDWAEDEDIEWTILLTNNSTPSEKSSIEEETEKDEFIETQYCVHGTTLTIKQQPHKGIAHQVWHAGLFLAEFLSGYPTKENATHWWTNKRVVELGAGTGIPGLLLATKGAEVTLTDLPPVIPLLDWNIQRNSHLFPSSHSCRAQPLAWGEAHEHISKPIDVVVAADVVYWECNFAPLVHTLVDICSEETIVFISWQKRRKADKYFFKILSKHFVCETLRFVPSENCVLANSRALKKMNLFKIIKKPNHFNRGKQCNSKKCIQNGQDGAHSQ